MDVAVNVLIAALAALLMCVVIAVLCTCGCVCPRLMVVVDGARRRLVMRLSPETPQLNMQPSSSQRQFTTRESTDGDLCYRTAPRERDSLLVAPVQMQTLDRNLLSSRLRRLLNQDDETVNNEGDSATFCEQLLRQPEPLSLILNGNVTQMLSLELVKTKIPRAQSTCLDYYFSSPDISHNKEELVVIIWGERSVGAGREPRRLTSYPLLESGALIAYIQQAKLEGWSVVVIDVNHGQYVSETGDFLTCRNPEKCASAVWKAAVRQCPARAIAVITNSYGGHILSCLLRTYNSEFKDRVAAIAITDSLCVIAPSDEQYFREVARNWVTSPLPLDVNVGYGYGCDNVSAGTTIHEETYWNCVLSVFSFIREQFQMLRTLLAAFDACKENSKRNGQQNDKRGERVKMSDTAHSLPQGAEQNQTALPPKLTSEEPLDGPERQGKIEGLLVREEMQRDSGDAGCTKTEATARAAGVAQLRGCDEQGNDGGGAALATCPASRAAPDAAGSLGLPAAAVGPVRTRRRNEPAQVEYKRIDPRAAGELLHGADGDLVCKDGRKCGEAPRTLRSVADKEFPGALEVMQSSASQSIVRDGGALLVPLGSSALRADARGNLYSKNNDAGGVVAGTSALRRADTCVSALTGSDVYRASRELSSENCMHFKADDPYVTILLSTETLWDSVLGTSCDSQLGLSFSRTAEAELLPAMRKPSFSDEETHERDSDLSSINLQSLLRNESEATVGGTQPRSLFWESPTISVDTRGREYLQRDEPRYITGD